jgi:hypothetical protein
MTDSELQSLDAFTDSASGDPSADNAAGSPTEDSAHVVPNGPSLDVDRIDIKELYAVKLQRARTDPLIGHAPSMGYGPDGDHFLFDLAVKARFIQAIGTHPLYRIEKATWPEVAAYCMGASGDARVASSHHFVQIYKKALEVVVEMRAGDAMELPASLDDDRPFLPDGSEAARLAAGLREHIKDSQDQHFLASEYDDWKIDSVPKRFWSRFVSTPTTSTTAGNDTEPATTADQSATNSEDLSTTDLQDFL